MRREGVERRVHRTALSLAHTARLSYSSRPLLPSAVKTCDNRQRRGRREGPTRSHVVFTRCPRGPRETFTRVVRGDHVVHAGRRIFARAVRVVRCSFAYSCLSRTLFEWDSCVSCVPRTGFVRITTIFIKIFLRDFSRTLCEAHTRPVRPTRSLCECCAMFCNGFYRVPIQPTHATNVCSRH